MTSQLSIIIPTLNEADYLPDLLHSIVAQAFDGELEVMVVDGESTDNTVDVAHQFDHSNLNLRVLTTSRNVGHQRNFGAKYAQYPNLLFLDADVVLTPGLLNALAPDSKLKGMYIASIRHVAVDTDFADRTFLMIAHGLMALSRLGGRPVTPGDFILTSRAVHTTIGGFVEGALLGEDTDYGRRAVKAGAAYYFFWRRTVVGSDRRVRQMGRAKLLLLWCRAFLRVLKNNGPVFPNEGLEYPFGHYPKRNK